MAGRAEKGNDNGTGSKREGIKLKNGRRPYRDICNRYRDITP